jgi:thioredoxin-related protein
MFKKLLLLVLFVSTLLSASEIKWAKDYNSAIKEARAQNKPVLFVYSRHSCKYCKLLEETTFKDAKVIKALNRDFVSVTAYSDEGDYMPKELWRPGTPTIWFLYPTAEPMFQPLMGAVDAPNFLQALAIVHEEFSKSKKEEK